jgi:predicted esterase
MSLTEKEILYTTTNTYSTLNTLTSQTKNVWFVCHGMGYLSRYFLRYFEDLNPEENYIIAPQAQSKYYIPPKFKHVGSSWLTKEKTDRETDNVMRYFDSVFTEEAIPEGSQIIVLGYSQGVSVAMRYLASRKLNCSQLVLMSGGIPKELITSDFDFLNTSTKVSFIYGKDDEYLNDERMLYETTRAKELFSDKLNILPFDGKHEVKKDIINALI